MKRIFIILSFLMGFIVLASNYLVQFPVKYYGLQEILTYGAFTYPIAFLITDLANRSFGKLVARNIVYIGFGIGISFTLLFSTNWFRYSFFNSSIVRCSGLRQIKGQKMVCCTSYIFIYWIYC